MKKGTTFQEVNASIVLNFFSQFNLHRHLVEQHNNFQEDNNCLIDGSEEDEEYRYTCRLCGIEGKYYRNIYAHIENVREKKDSCFCTICVKEISFSSKPQKALQRSPWNFQFWKRIAQGEVKDIQL